MIKNLLYNGNFSVSLKYTFVSLLILTKLSISVAQRMCSGKEV